MKSRTKVLVAAGAAVVFAIPLGVTAQALAQEPAVIFQDEATAVATDLALIAKAKGWTLAQARAQREAGLRLDRVREAAAAAQGEAIIGGALAERPDGTPTLLVRGKATDAVRRLAAVGGVQVVDGQPYTAKELRMRASAVHDRLLAMGYSQVATGVNIATAGISAAVTAKAGLPATRSALAAALPDDLDDLGEGVTLTVADSPVVARQSSAFGGMRNLLNGVPMCTSGWSVIAPDGTTGVSTAGHCGVNQITHDGTTHSLALQAQHIGIVGDVEWGTTSVPEPDDFYTTASTVRDVSAVEPIANIMLGETICVYGRTTNAVECSTVVALDVTISDPVFGRSARLVAMGAVTQPGDSGGPWYNGGRAYGSHVGQTTVNGKRCSVFQVADLYDEALGVRVRTS